MGDIPIRFEPDDSLDEIEIVVRAPHGTKDIDELMKKLSDISITKLCAVDSEGCSRFLDESEILSVCTSGRQVRIITANDVFTAKTTLHNVEELLSKKRFMKISRFELVNSEKIRKFDFTIGGTLRLELEGGIETWASRRYIPLIKKHLLGKGEST